MKAIRKKSEKRSLNVIIPLEVYPFDLMVSIGELEPAFKESLDKFGVEYSESLALPENCLGRATLLPCNRSIIRLTGFPKIAKDHGILAHEIHHIVHFYMDRIGMQLTDASFEAYAYLHGYITEQIYKHILMLKWYHIIIDK